MSELQARINTLNDHDAQRILTVFIRNQPRSAENEKAPGLKEALNNELGNSTDADAERGALARAALLLLAEDSKNFHVISTLADGHSAEQFGIIETAAVVSAVLFVLGTYVKIERDKEGKWLFKVEKKPTDIELLKSLQSSLMNLLEKRN